MAIRDHSGGSQLPPEDGADRNRAASCLLRMSPTEIEQPAASKRCRSPRPGQPAASSRCRGPRPGQPAASTRCRGPKASSWLPPVRARGPRRRSRLPSARSSERATKQPDATRRSSRSAWRKTAARQPSQRSASVHPEGSARKRRSRARAARCDRAAFTLRQALTRPKNRRRCRNGRSAHAFARR